MASYDDGNWQELPELYRLELGNIGSTVITELMPGEYVGNGDSVDYRQITVAESGLYSFHFYGLTNPAELTVYVEENGRLRELEDEDGKRGENIILDPIRLNVGQVYYIAVRPEGISWQQGAGYSVGITRSGGTSSSGGYDDDWSTAPQLTVRGDRQKVDMDLVSDGYIGNGDYIDYRRVVFEKDGSYTIKLDDLRSSAKLTLYRVVDGGISEIASVAGDRRTDGVLRNLAIRAGEYVIAVEPGSPAASGTEYEVEIEGIVYSGSGDNSDDVLSPDVLPAVTVAPDAWGNVDAELIENEWVGYDDLIDYRKLDIAEAGVYSFTLEDLSSDAKLTLYSLNGSQPKKLKSVTGKAGKKGVVANLLLERGTCYLSVEASGRTKKGGTGYDVEVSGSAFTKGDNSDDSRDSVPQLSVDGSGGWVEQTLIDDGWVGYGDFIDYREIVLNTPGSYRFELEGLDNSAKLTVYEAGGKKLKSVTGKAGDTEQKFTFTVKLDRAISGAYGDMTFNNGTAVVTLKHGESSTATKLPADIHYTVTESDNDGYTVTANGATGVISDGKTAVAAFINTKDSDAPDQPSNPDSPVTPNQPGSPDVPNDSGTPDDVPKMGDTMNLGLWISLMGLSLAGLFISLVVVKKRTRRNRHSN